MRFVVETVSPEGVRRGLLIWSTPSGEASATTPLCLPYTRAGAVPHLTVDLLDKVLRAGGQEEDGKLALLSLPTLHEVPGVSVIAQCQSGIRNFTHMKVSPLCLCCRLAHSVYICTLWFTMSLVTKDIRRHHCT